jgi:hypothetical protein
VSKSIDMDMKTIEEGRWSQRQIFEAIPILVLAVSSVCFVLGLLIVNEHYAMFGIYSDELLRTQYILAGAVFILLVMTAEFCVRRALKAARVIEARWRQNKYLDVCFSILIGLPSIFLPLPIGLVLLNAGELVALKPLAAQLAGIMMVWAMLSPMLSGLTGASGVLSSLRLGSIVEHIAGDFYEFFMPVVGVLMASWIYSLTVFPVLSPAYGGGHEISAMLYPSKRGIEICSKFGLPVRDDQTVGPVRILSVTEKSVTVIKRDKATTKDVAVQLSRDLFDAIQMTSWYGGNDELRASAALP